MIEISVGMHGCLGSRSQEPQLFPCIMAPNRFLLDFYHQDSFQDTAGASAILEFLDESFVSIFFGIFFVFLVSWIFGLFLKDGCNHDSIGAEQFVRHLAAEADPDDAAMAIKMIIFLKAVDVS